MPQGSLKLRKPPTSGGKKNVINRGRAGKKTRKGSVVKKPKNSELASAVNKKKKVTAQIVTNIEKEMANKLKRNGGDLATVDNSIKESAEAKGKTPRFKPRKQHKT